MKTHLSPAKPSRRRPPGETPVPLRRARVGKPLVGKTPKLVYLSLVAILFFSSFPLYFSVIVASEDNSVLARTPPPLLPGANLVENVRRVFTTVDFGGAMVNSLIITTTITVSVVFFSTLAGFAFAKLRFRGSTALLLVTVGTMMVPAQLGIIPLYLLMIELEWTGQLQAVIVPALVNAFGVFFMTQYLRDALPTELLEAGRMDGCSTQRLFWHVVVPAARPAAAVLGMLTFLSAWNDYMWPLIVLGGTDNPTVQTALSALRSGYITDYSLSLTGTLLATVPLLVSFVVLGRQLIGGIMQGAVKG